MKKNAMCSLLAVVCLGVVGAGKVVRVTDLGAVGDGKTLDTAAFEAALEVARSTPGTRIVAPSGGRYLIAPINLTSHTTLHIEANATIVGVKDRSAWPLIPGAPSYGQGRDHPGPRYTSLLHGEHVEDVAVVGEGETSVLDGNGEYWWDAVHDLNYTRGHLLEFMYSRRVRVFDVAMVDSPFWNNHFFDTEDVHVRGVRISAKFNSPNTDGWDPDSARDVLVEESSYSGGDDCVAIKSGWDCFGVAYGKPSKNITIRNVNCTGPHAGIAIGSEMSGGVEDVLVQGVRILGEANGIAHVKTGPTRGGFVRNVRFVDMSADGASLEDAILVDSHYGSRNPSCPDSWNGTLPLTSDVSFVRIDARDAHCSHHAVQLTGEADMPIEGIYLEDVHVGSGDWDCDAVSGTAKAGTVAPWPPCDSITPAASH